MPEGTEVEFKFVCGFRCQEKASPYKLMDISLVAACDLLVNHGAQIHWSKAALVSVYCVL